MTTYVTRPDLQAKVDDLNAQLATAHIAQASAEKRAEDAEAQADALRQLVADLCRTRKPTEFGTYEDALTWMRARCIANGGGM